MLDHVLGSLIPELTWLETHRDQHVIQGISWPPDFGGRIEDAYADACTGLGRDDAVLVVSSGGVIGRTVADALGANAEAAIHLNLQTRNTGVTEIVRGSSAVRIAAFNGVPHLERPDRAHALTHS